jgi:hypothetical protein
MLLLNALEIPEVLAVSVPAMVSLHDGQADARLAQASTSKRAGRRLQRRMFILNSYAD